MALNFIDFLLIATHFAVTRELLPPETLGLVVMTSVEASHPLDQQTVASTASDNCCSTKSLKNGEVQNEVLSAATKLGDVIE